MFIFILQLLVMQQAPALPSAEWVKSETSPKSEFKKLTAPHESRSCMGKFKH